MSENTTPFDERLSSIAAQSSSNAQDIKELRTELVSARNESRAEMSQIRAAIGELGQKFTDRITSATAPNFSHIWAAAGVAVALGSIVANFQFREMGRHEQALKDMDVKLQREQILMQNETKAWTGQVDLASKERHEQMRALVESQGKRIDNLSQWVTEEAHSDMQELRQRRVKAAPTTENRP